MVNVEPKMVNKENVANEEPKAIEPIPMESKPKKKAKIINAKTTAIIVAFRFEDQFVLE